MAKKIDVPALVTAVKAIPISDVLRKYGAKPSDIDRHIKCPIPAHGASGATPSFKVYSDTNSYYCWGCKSAGSTIDLAMAMESKSLVEAALILADKFGIEVSEKDYYNAAEAALTKAIQARLHRESSAGLRLLKQCETRLADFIRRTRQSCDAGSVILLRTLEIEFDEELADLYRSQPSMHNVMEFLCRWQQRLLQHPKTSDLKILTAEPEPPLSQLQDLDLSFPPDLIPE
jgi:DNA primase